MLETLWGYPIQNYLLPAIAIAGTAYLITRDSSEPIGTEMLQHKKEHKMTMLFTEDKNVVHVMFPSDENYTLCGTCWGESYDLKSTGKKIVTCPECIQELKALKKVKYRED